MDHRNIKLAYECEERLFLFLMCAHGYAVDIAMNFYLSPTVFVIIISKATYSWRMSAKYEYFFKHAHKD